MAVCTIIISFEGGKNVRECRWFQGLTFILLYIWGKNGMIMMNTALPDLEQFIVTSVYLFFHALMYIVFILFDEKKKFDFSFLL